jgi:hypothetical protein
LRRSPGNRLALVALIATTAGIALGACDQPSRPEAGKAPAPAAVASPGAPLDACAFLTPADAREILGSEVAAPTRSIVPGSGETVSQCSYAGATDASPRPRRFLSLLVRQSPAAPAAYDRARAMAKALTGSDPVDVSGVGEKAYWTGGTFKQLTVLAKNVQLVVSVELGDGRDRVEGTKLVARKALSRL